MVMASQLQKTEAELATTPMTVGAIMRLSLKKACMITASMAWAGSTAM